MGHDARTNPFSREYSGPITAVDARGRALQEGDEVILATVSPIYLRVGQITPVLDPGAPQGLIQVHLACVATFTLKGGVPTPTIVRVRTAEEAGPNPVKLLDVQPAAQD